MLCLRLKADEILVLGQIIIHNHSGHGIHLGIAAPAEIAIDRLTPLQGILACDDRNTTATPKTSATTAAPTPS